MFRILAAALLAALALAPAASAKEIAQVKACGPEGCQTLETPGMPAHGLFPEENLPGDMPQAGAFYRLEIGMGDGSGKVFDTFSVLWAPHVGMLANDEPTPTWYIADDAAKEVAREVSAGVKPFPAADMPGALAPAPAPAPDDGGVPWWPFAIAVAAGALLLTLARRRGASRAARSASPPPSPARG